MPEEDMDVAVLGSFLDDDCARRILSTTLREPKSASELVAHCDASRATVYRRLEELEAENLVEVRQRPDDEGHHYKVYAASLDRAVIDFTTEGIELSISRRDQMADRFRRFIEGL
jgi:predicted transcriptional regulator